MVNDIRQPVIEDYELLASGDGERLERWNGRVILRPESAAVWPWSTPGTLPEWEGRYTGNRATGGEWIWRNPLPSPCVLRHGNLSFLIKPTASKHLGLFPEQASNWEWIREILSRQPAGNKPPRILNLFGYTGGATLVAASAGASVTHVDAAKAMVAWCADNARLSGLREAPIRYIVEDALAFLRKEVRRGNRYEGIVMDPPSYGRGKGGALWKLQEHLPLLLEAAREGLSESPLFLLLNTYSPEMDRIAGAMVSSHLSGLGGSLHGIGLGLTGTLDSRRLPSGVAHRWLP